MKKKEMLNNQKNELVSQDHKHDRKTIRTVHPDTWKEIYTIWSIPPGSWWDKGIKKTKK
ncbi:hypothetical protein JWJ90_13090 [Desulfobulbus rhabdoformis]|jgi:hypothetical protein|uniref:hypothetical protein n=1 Tax=Desulfobulbus rhabdoformis TaxID=34032 RepID=UPI0019652CD8|nr:hypothetical protein [Desulfobulbus rhabdoformis]MBM9615216.1 hypothetical protein [Desulfobulbus rhabdoformis]